MKVTNNTYIVEGETEVVLLQHLFDKGVLAPGKKQVFNLWEKDVSKIRRKFSKTNNTIYIIFDMDVLVANAKFNKNLKALVGDKTVKEIILMPQRLNFEDELSHSCGCGLQALYDLFNAAGAGEFKSRFIASKAISKTLTIQGFDHRKLWVRPVVEQIEVPVKKTTLWSW